LQVCINTFLQVIIFFCRFFVLYIDFALLAIK